MKFEMLSEDHQSYATNPIIAHALFYVKYIEEIGSGTVDMFDLCKATGLRPPEFDIDARHFTVTVYRPEFDDHGNRIPASGEEVRVKTEEVGPKTAEVGVKTAEVGVKNPEVKANGGEVKVKTITNGSEPITNLVEVGPKPQEVSPYLEQISPKPDFEVAMKGYRKDLRETCGRIWSCLAANIDLTQRELAVQLRISESSVLSAMNALQEVGLLKREGYGKGRKWIVKSSVENPESDG
jgi:predicted HTH transcriptional regulator